MTSKEAITAKSQIIKKEEMDLEKILVYLREYEGQTLAEIITKYDFIVSSEECKNKLMEMLPEGANIICKPYVASISSPMTAYVFKKFNTINHENTDRSGVEE